jgi:16S rRNA (guanine966-N2)-methyltransferase
LRVISGTARGKKLFSPDGKDTRPTADRVKESIFNIIAPCIRDAVVLDLFAGSGSLGIEALSRGAKKAVFCENSKKAMEIVKKNLAASNLAEKSVLEKRDYLDYLNTCDEVFDIIFLDPPYTLGYYEKALDVIKKRRLLSPEGIVVAERGKAYDISFPGFEIIKDRRYGNSFVTIFKRMDENKNDSSLPGQL